MCNIVHNNTCSNKVDYIGGAPEKLVENIVSTSNEIEQLPGVNKIVLLPDVHLKQKYVKADYKITVPSSAVISSEVDSFYPQFRSRGIGCGMMIIGTGLTIDDLPGGTETLLKKFPSYLTNNTPVYPDNIPKKRTSFALSEDDIIQMCLRGAPWVCQEFGLSGEIAQNFWKNGSFFSESERNNFSWEGFNQQWTLGQATDGRRIGLDLTGNHFLEAQYVHTTPTNSEDLRLKKREIAFMYHGSCNGLEWVLEQKIINRTIKLPIFEKIMSNNKDYDLIFQAIKVLLNWSAAARCLVVARLKSLLQVIFPSTPYNNFRCVSELPHNTVFIESINGKQKIIYRHNAVPIIPGQPIIVSGRYDHPSYLFAPGESPEHSLNTLDHGIGAILKHNSSELDFHQTTSSWRIEQLYYRGMTLWKRKQQLSLINSAMVESHFQKHYEREGLVGPENYILHPLVTLKQGGFSPRQTLKNLIGNEK